MPTLNVEQVEKIAFHLFCAAGDPEEHSRIVAQHLADNNLAGHDSHGFIRIIQAFDLWLDTTNVDATTAAALIAPAPEGLLEAYEISTAVNRTANDNPKLLEPAGATAPELVKPPARPTRAKRGKKDDGQASLL